MRRAMVIGLAAVAAVVGAAFALGAGAEKGTTYKIVLDNAFGLVEGADFKVGGVPVGSISGLDVSRRDARAIVEVEVSESGEGFSGLRESTTCTVAPQSLIGEYFVDCQPGEDGPLLDSGATVPVERTTSPIPPDLVLNVMRQPVRQRFATIFSELGIGFAARGEDIEQTIRRAIPALTETSKVLELLATRRRTLADLAREGGQVMRVLGERREDVGDFVVAARDAAEATAVRRAELAETFRRFPGFLDQLTPTMADLGVASRRLEPTLADLRAAAPSVTSLLGTLPRFAGASEPAVTTLGEASDAGRTASREAASLVARLGELGQASPEPARNLRFILDHLNNREFAVEDDPDSPGGEGYTGLEAVLQYPFDQSLAINVFDQRGYTLKLNITAGECSDYTSAEDVRDDPGKYERCNQNLGPNQPNVTTPDVGSGETRGEETSARAADRPADAAGAGDPPQAAAPSGTATPGDPAEALPIAPVQDLLERLPELVRPVDQQSATDLLDFLMRP